MPRQTKAKTITAAKRLEVFALFTMAKQHNEKATEFWNALKETLGTDTADHFSDAIWGDYGDFDSALQKEGFIVQTKPRKKRGR